MPPLFGWLPRYVSQRSLQSRAESLSHLSRRLFARNTPSLDRSKFIICSWEKREYRLPPVEFGVSPTRPRTGEFLLPRSSLLLKPRLTPVGESSCRNLSRFFRTSKNTWIKAPLNGTESAILIGQRGKHRSHLGHCFNQKWLGFWLHPLKI